MSDVSLPAVITPPITDSDPDALAQAHARIAALEADLAAARAETAAQRDHFQRVIDQLPMRLFWKDRDSRYLGVNRMMLVDLGQPDPSKVIGRTDSDIGMPEADMYHNDDRQVMTSGEAMRDKEEMVVSPTGETYYTTTTKTPLRAADGTIEGLLGVYYDITARKRSEIALEQLLRQAGDIIDLNDTLGDATSLDDMLTRLSMLSVIEDAAAITAFTFEEGKDGKPGDVVIAANRTKTGTSIVTMPLGTRYPATEFSLTRLYVDDPETSLFIEDVEADPRVDPVARGTLLYLNIPALIIIPLYRYGHNLGSIVISYSQKRTFSAEERQAVEQLPSILTQIVERLRLIDSLQTSINELNAALIFKDQFLAIMSHELRTPLNAILGFSSIAQQLDPDEPGTGERIQHMMTRIVANSERLLNLINAILDLSRINAGRVEIVADPFDLHATARGWHEDFGKQARDKGLDFTFALDESLPVTVTGDHERISQIVGNLIENAVKFTEQGGVNLTVQRQEGSLCIQVRDTGIGISPTWHHLIFEEFRRVEMDSIRKTGGAGLGLSIVQRLAKLMGGNVSVESELGKGSTFTVVLPLNATRS